MIDVHDNPVLTYEQMGMPQRNHPGEVTEFVADFIGKNRARNGTADAFRITYENGPSRNL